MFQHSAAITPIALCPLELDVIFHLWLNALHPPPSFCFGYPCLPKPDQTPRAAATDNWKPRLHWKTKGNTGAHPVEYRHCFAPPCSEQIPYLLSDTVSK